MRVIVFSKDRAFQLGQYLRTLFAFCRGAELDVHVLYRADPAPQQGSAVRRDFAASYERVQAAFPSVHFVREVDFAAQVARRCLARPPPLSRAACCLLLTAYCLLLVARGFTAAGRLFLVPAQGAGGRRRQPHSLWRRRRAVLRRPPARVRAWQSVRRPALSLQCQARRTDSRSPWRARIRSEAVAALQTNSWLLCVHLRLSPGLAFCHTANAMQRLPRRDPAAPHHSPQLFLSPFFSSTSQHTALT